MTDKYDTWIPKAEVMSRLGFSERTIDRMVEKGQLKQGYKPIPGRRPLPVYDPKSVEAVEAEMVKAQSPVPAPADPDRPTTALVPKDTKSAGDFFARLIESIGTGKVSIADKFFLTVKEASELSGLPKAYIIRQIHEGKLSALKAGGYRIRRADLEKL